MEAPAMPTADSLLCTVYSQCWPAPGCSDLPRNFMDRIHSAPTQRRHVRQLQIADSRASPNLTTSTPRTCTESGDKPKLQRAWPLTSNASGIRDSTPTTPKTISKMEIKKLEEQVKEFNQNFHHRSALKRYLRGAYKEPALNGSSSHLDFREELNGSTQAFQRRPVPVRLGRSRGDGSWNSVTKPTSTSSSDIDLRLTQSVPGSRCETPSVSASRPQSSASTNRLHKARQQLPFPNSQTGTYDTLTPEIVFTLSRGSRSTSTHTPDCVYGERSTSSMSMNSRAATPATRSISRLSNSDLEPTIPDDLSDVSSTLSDSDESDLSEGERGDEASPSDVTPRQLPKDLTDIHPLRPELQDLDVTQQSQRRRFDFDATVCEQPPYKFSDPIPKVLRMTDLTEVVRSGKDLNSCVTDLRQEGWCPTSVEAAWVRRLMELTRLQDQTVIQERTRVKSAGRARRRQTYYERVKNAERRDRRCISDCVQPACVGDCPGKRRSRPVTPAAEDPYDAHQRADPLPDSPEKPQRRLKSCNSCSRTHTAKLINANGTVLGRPRSSHHTYSRGQSSAKPKDLRSTESPCSEIAEKLELLGVSTTKRTVKSRPITARSGRSAILPGKSSSSQRRKSITDHRRLYRSRMRSLKIKRSKQGTPLPQDNGISY